MRSRHAVTLIVTFMALAVFGVFAGWAIYDASGRDGGWESLRTAWPYLAAGALTVAAVTAVLMWLAFYSSSHGYDDNVDDRS